VGPRPRRARNGRGRGRGAMMDELEAMMAGMPGMGSPEDDDGGPKDEMRLGYYIHKGEDNAAADWLRFWCHALQYIAPGCELADRLVADEVMLMLKVKQLPNDPALNCAQYKDQVAMGVDRLWHAKVAREAPKAREGVAAALAQGMALRQLGNAAFKVGDLAEADRLYSEALKTRWDDEALLMNRSLVRLKQGRPHAAMEDADCAVSISPRCAKAWARWGDALAAKSWHRAALLVYRQALELYGQAAEYAEARGDVSTRIDDAAAKLAASGTKQWEVDEIVMGPKGDDYRALFRWLQVKPSEVAAFKEVCRSQGLGELFTKLRKREPERLLATCQLKPHILAAAAVAAAPAVPQRRDISFIASYTDRPTRDKSSGVPCFMISIFSHTGERRCSPVVLGTPRVPAVLTAMAIAAPDEGAPMRPASVLLAHRYLPWWDVIKAELSKWGIGCELETRPEAVYSARNNNTHPDGLNHVGAYVDRVDDD